LGDKREIIIVRELCHRFVVTENCNLDCPHCFNAEARDRDVMDADLYIKFIRENSHHLGDKRCLIMGGEPTLHPRIIEIIMESTKHYQLVDLFTNGTRLNKIAKHPDIVREHFKDKITYTINGYAFDHVKYEEWRDFNKRLNLHFVITMWGHEEITQKMFKCMEYYPNVKYTISCDTQVDVFDEEVVKNYRKIYIDTLKKIIPELQGRGIEWGTDHSFPICFYTQEMINELNMIDLTNHHFGTTCCTCPKTGLINANWDFQYCNQTRIKLGTVLKEDGSLKTMTELQNEYITPSHKLKTEYIKNLREECRDCKAVSSCRVGCYYNALVEHSSKGRIR
jgi:radical SAM protein with 4Fe4S-binding SPASM domain